MSLPCWTPNELSTHFRGKCQRISLPDFWPEVVAWSDPQDLYFDMFLEGCRHSIIPAPPSLQTVVGWLQKNETTIIGVAGGFIQTQLGIIYFGDQRVPLVALASALERADFGKNSADGEVTEV
ncbi:hypothetical protein DdX_03010 [Ditylenchus destructor]|uniref:Uncharacterized protein n=1 Tax=Ditylenchus destructor TaxID=166010 RepID=A0AAD4NH68_9BILA|nr:hypothetical protein DdX_03010 [Ditylenchus destructor]